MGVEVLVVQHGDKARAPGDPGLTEIGHRQAAAVASWIAEGDCTVAAVMASPLRRAKETAAPIAAALGLVVQTDGRLRERMNWEPEAGLDLDEFLAEWRRASETRSYRPSIGDSSNDAAARFIDAMTSLERVVGDGVAVVVTHGGVTVDALRTIAGDTAVERANPGLITEGVPCGAITRLLVELGTVTVVAYPATTHLDSVLPHRPA